MGLLDQFTQGVAPSAPQGGGLLGAFAPQGGAPAAAAGGGGLQMAQALAANPTPQMVEQVIAQMKQAGMPEADQVAQLLEQAGDDTQRIKRLADIFVQELSK